MIVSTAWLGPVASRSLIGGTIRPSSNTLVARLGIDPGTAPPMSSWWPNAWTNATTLGGPPASPAPASPACAAAEWKTGTVTHRSGRWPMPPSEEYTSLWKYTSPGRMVSIGKSRTIGWTSEL